MRTSTDKQISGTQPTTGGNSMSRGPINTIFFYIKRGFVVSRVTERVAKQKMKVGWKPATQEEWWETRSNRARFEARIQARRDDWEVIKQERKDEQARQIMARYHRQ